MNDDLIKKRLNKTLHSWKCWDALSGHGQEQGSHHPNWMMMMNQNPHNIYIKSTAKRERVNICKIAQSKS